MNNHDSNHDQKFFCTSKRSMSLISAALIVVFFLTFMTGYVWGKRVALEDVLKAVEQKTFADQISGSLYALSAHDFDTKKDEPQESESVVISAPLADEVAQIIPEQIIVAIDAQQSKKEIALGVQPVCENVALKAESDPEKISDTQHYYAQLIGFNAKKTADKFVGLLKNNPLKVVIKERVSTGIHGKKKVWYQVVTQQYTDKEELEQLVAHVVKKEHLSGVQIVPC